MDQPHRMKYAKSPGLGLDSRPPPAAPPALGLALLLDRVSHQQATNKVQGALWPCVYTRSDSANHSVEFAETRDRAATQASERTRARAREGSPCAAHIVP